MMLLKKMFTAAVFAFTAGILFCGTEVSAQGMPTFFKKGNGQNGRGDTPTVIESATMDLDLENNITTLIGNVVVDDVSMKIVCNKMIIYMVDKEEAPAAAADSKKDAKPADKAKTEEAKKDDAKKDEAKNADAKKPEASNAGNDAFDSSGKELKKVECYGDVVITKKPDPDKPKAKEQVATSDFALYDLETNTITLTGKPVLTSGADKLVCQKIVFVMDTGRIKVMGGTITSYGDLQKNNQK